MSYCKWGSKLSCLQMRVVTAAAQHIFREASAIWLGQSPPCCNTLLQGDCLLKFPMQCGFRTPFEWMSNYWLLLAIISAYAPSFFSSISTCSWWFCILGDISPLLLYFKQNGKHYIWLDDVGIRWVMGWHCGYTKLAEKMMNQFSWLLVKYHSYNAMPRLFVSQHVGIGKTMPAAVLRHKIMLPPQAQHRRLAPAGCPPPQLRSGEAPAVQGPCEVSGRRCLEDLPEDTIRNMQAIAVHIDGVVLLFTNSEWSEYIVNCDGTGPAGLRGETGFDRPAPRNCQPPVAPPEPSFHSKPDKQESGFNQRESDFDHGSGMEQTKECFNDHQIYVDVTHWVNKGFHQQTVGPTQRTLWLDKEQVWMLPNKYCTRADRTNGNWLNSLSFPRSNSTSARITTTHPIFHGQPVLAPSCQLHRPWWLFMSLVVALLLRVWTNNSCKGPPTNVCFRMFFEHIPSIKSSHQSWN